MSKVLICVPCMESVPADFARSLAMIQRGQNDVALGFEVGSLIYTSRNQLARYAIETEADYTLWFDSDMVFNPDTLIRMVNTAKEKKIDFLTGVYYRRKPPFTPVLFDKLEIDLEKEEADYSEFQDIPDGLFKVGGTGFGCCLVDAGIFLDVQTKFGNMFSPIGGNGEDVSFCWRARQCGYEIWADPSIQLGHVATTTVTAETWKAIRNYNKEVK